MAKVIKNLKIDWTWGGDNYLLKGFNVAITPINETPNTKTIITATVDNVLTYTFVNLTLDDTIQYTAWVQAIYDTMDGDWLSAGNVSVSDDGTSTIETQSTNVANAWKYAGTTQIDGGDIYTGTITANKITANTITAGSGVIANGAITTAMIADANITSAKIVDTSITNAKINDLAVTNAKINDLNGTKITANTISADKLTIGLGEQGGFLKNPRFTAWGGTYPDGSAIWSSGGISKVVVDSMNMPQFTCPDTGDYGMTLGNSAFANGVNLDGIKYFCLELRFRLTSGTSASGAGMLVDIFRSDATYQRLSLPCSDAGATLTTNAWYTVRKIFEITDVDIAKTFTSVSGYLLANYSSLGAKIAKTIQFASINMYTATRQDFLTQSWTYTGSTTIAGGMIQTGTITADRLVANTITSASGVIADATITTAKIADANVTTAKIVDANITNAKIANLAVDTGKIADASITTAKITDANITTAKIANLAVDSTKIADATITTAKIADAQITTAKIANATITDANISSLNADKITAGTLSANRIGADSITADKIKIGDFSNLAQINPDTYTNGNTVENVSGLNYFKVGQSAYANIQFKQSPTVDFSVNDEYVIELYGYKDSAITGAINFIVRYYYSDASYANAGIVAIPFTTSASSLTASCQITVAPNTAKVLTNVKFFIEKDSTTTGYYRLRDIVINKKTDGALIINGSITASKIATGTILIGNLDSATQTKVNNGDSANTTVNANSANWTDAKAKVDLWKHASDYTKIDGGDIYTGTVTANSIASNTITTDKLLIGDFTNYASWANKSASTSPWLSSILVDTGTYHDTTCSLKIPPSTTAIGLKNNIPVVAGDVFYCEFWAKVGSAFNGMSANTKLRLGNQSGSPLYTISFNTATTSWTKFSGTYTVPTGTTYLVISLGNDGTGTDPTGSVWVDDVVIVKQVNNVSIQDGAINASKIQAGTITADRMVAGTITAGSGIIGSIDASKITTGTLSANYINGGTLTLGGSGNGNGVEIIKDASGNEMGRIDNTGIALKNGKFAIQASTATGFWGYENYGTSDLMTVDIGEINSWVSNSGATVAEGTLIGDQYKLKSTGLFMGKYMGNTAYPANRHSCRLENITNADNVYYERWNAGTTTVATSSFTWLYGDKGLNIDAGSSANCNTPAIKIDSSSNVTLRNATVTGVITANGGLKYGSFSILNGTDTWLRTNGATGWYSATYGGGIFCDDSTYVKVYGSKIFYGGSGVHSGAEAHFTDGTAYSDPWNGTTCALKTTGKISSTGGFYFGASHLPWSGNINRFQNVSGSSYMAIYDDNATTYGTNIWVSDISLKENIVDSNADSLSKIIQIEHKEFDWKTGGHVSMAYVAQQLKSIDKEFVFAVEQEDMTELLNPATSVILPHVTRAIQQMKNIIDEQKNTIDNLIELLKLKGVI